MADLQRVSLDEIVVHFQELEDPRSTINQRHPLASVVVIALLAVLADVPSGSFAFGSKRISGFSRVMWLRATAAAIKTNGITITTRSIDIFFIALLRL